MDKKELTERALLVQQKNEKKLDETDTPQELFDIALSCVEEMYPEESIECIGEICGEVVELFSEIL